MDGDLGLRLARAGETLGETRPLSARQLVIADGERPVAIVLGEVGEDAGVTPDTERMILCALGVKGVPRIAWRKRCGARPRRFTLEASCLTFSSGQSARRLYPARSQTSARRGARCSTRSPASRTSSSQLFCSTWPRTNMPRPAVAGRGGGPRLLSLGELEELRDDLADRVADSRRALSDRT